MNLKENQLFKEYHDSRIKRIQMEIEEGIWTQEQGEEMLESLNLDEITEEEVQAH